MFSFIQKIARPRRDGRYIRGTTLLTFTSYGESRPRIYTTNPSPMPSIVKATFTYNGVHRQFPACSKVIRLFPSFQTLQPMSLVSAKLS